MQPLPLSIYRPAAATPSASALAAGLREAPAADDDDKEGGVAMTPLLPALKQTHGGYAPDHPAAKGAALDVPHWDQQAAHEAEGARRAIVVAKKLLGESTSASPFFCSSVARARRGCDVIVGAGSSRRENE